MFTSSREADNLGVVRFPMSQWVSKANVLVGRDQGEIVRAVLEGELRKLSPADPVVLDFDGVEVVTVSFADGFFVPLLSGWSAGYYGEHPLLALGADDEVAETIDAVLRLRNMAVLAIGERGPQLLGGELAMDETVAAAYQLEHFSAADLAQRLGITPQAANNRLKVLVQRGALVRRVATASSGGKVFGYRFPRADEPGQLSAKDVARAKVPAGFESGG